MGLSFDGGSKFLRLDFSQGLDASVVSGDLDLMDVVVAKDCLATVIKDVEKAVDTCQKGKADFWFPLFLSFQDFELLHFFCICLCSKQDPCLRAR